MHKSTGSPSRAHPISTLDEAAWDELVAEWPGESASPTCSAPTLDEGIADGEVLPGYQPGVFTFVRVPDGWRRLRFIDVDFFRWPGDSKPEGYPELGLATARWYREERKKRLGQPFDFGAEIAQIAELLEVTPEVVEGWLETRPEMEAGRWTGGNPKPLKFEFDDAVRIARHWLADWPGSVDFEDLRDWLVASFFTIAGGHQPPLVNGDTYRFIDRNTKLRAVRLDENVVGRCIEKAASSNVHHEALCKAGELILRRNPRRLGGALRGWIADDMAGSLPRCGGRPPGKNALRDRAIIAVIERLVAEGMSATRNDASLPNSACDAIEKATGKRVTYAAARDVWKAEKRRKR